MMLGTDKMGASTPLAEACEMSALAIHRERDPSQPQSSRVSLWQGGGVYLESYTREARFLTRWDQHAVAQRRRRSSMTEEDSFAGLR